MRKPPPSPLFILIVLLSYTGLLASTERIPTRVFNPGYLQGDCSYHSLTAASDGMIYFSVCTHHDQSSARLFQFDPATELIVQIGDLGNILGEDSTRQIPQGKIHTPLIEHEDYLYFSTHTSYYSGNLPNRVPPDGRAPYPGGHFMRYHLPTGTFEDLAQLKLPNEGIITMAVDTVNDTLYGLTWPTGLLISFNLEEKLLHNWGAVQGRGEWGPLQNDWNFICRRLAVDDAGNVYGATDTGRIWRFIKDKQRPVEYLDKLNVADIAPPPEPGFTHLPEAHFFWNNWRTILWNPSTDSFWGLQGGSTQLFEFKPESSELRPIGLLRPDDVPQDTRRNPFRSQLGFTLGPENTLYYLAHGPGIEVNGRDALDTSVHLLSYQIDTDRLTDHGILAGPEDQRIFFAESLELDKNGHLYSVAWVEVTDPTRMDAIQSARAQAAPAETDEVIYEIQLVQLPTLKELTN